MLRTCGIGTNPTESSAPFSPNFDQKGIEKLLQTELHPLLPPKSIRRPRVAEREDLKAEANYMELSAGICGDTPTAKSSTIRRSTIMEAKVIRCGL